METTTLFPVDHIRLYIFVAKFMFPLFASLNNIHVCVYIGVSNLLTREVVEWMGMGVAAMLVIEMNRYTKSACRCTCVWKIIVRMDMHFNKCEWIC